MRPLGAEAGSEREKRGENAEGESEREREGKNQCFEKISIFSSYVFSFSVFIFLYFYFFSSGQGSEAKQSELV